MKIIDLLDPEAKVPAEGQIKLNEAIRHIFKSKRTAVLTGAGISCNAGIPDFRSSDGLYEMVKKKYPKAVVKGQDLFDISLFRDEITLSLFCTFMESLYRSSLDAEPTETHRFIKSLKDKNKLLRCYTQNIDSLEGAMDLNMGINMDLFNGKTDFNRHWKNLDVVQLHGNLHKLSCTLCFSSHEWNQEYQDQLSQGSNPQCENCHAKYIERLYLGKRITGNVGILRPDIVLYGEDHPQSEILSQGLNIDLKMRADLLIIMGTSLKVDGIKKLARALCKTVHERGGKVVFVNKTPIGKQWENFVDYEILSDCDNFVKILKTEIPDLFLTQEQLDSKKLKRGNKVKEEDNDAKENKESKVKKEPKEPNLTPPPTPKKRPALKRKNPNTPSKRVKCELPTPMSSFNE